MHWIESVFEVYVQFMMIILPAILVGLILGLISAFISRVYKVIMDRRAFKRGYYIEWEDHYYQDDKYY